jgi:CDP-diacylglycerol--glycerol-3-phosphate 3-phosphatidyltransferase
MNWTIPNLLSIIRVLAAPCVAIAFVMFERPEADRIAILIFVGAAATDYLDGLLARILRQESAFGRMLDPIADKAMVMIALTIIISLFNLEWPVVVPAVLIILREVLISGLREFLGDVKLQVTRMAKWKTTLQMFAICLLLLRGAAAPELSSEPVSPIVAKVMSGLAIGAGSFGLLMLWVAAWFTIVTGFDYVRKGMPYIREKEGTTTKAPVAVEPET